MIKREKIWLGIFLAMVIVPEVLWSPALSFTYELFQTGNTHPLRNNFLTSLQNINWTRFFILLEGVGIISLMGFIWKNKIQNITLWILEILLLVYLLFLILLLYLSLALAHSF